MSLASVLTQLATSLTQIGVAAASQPAIASAVINGAGGPSSVVNHSLNALMGAFGTPRVQPLVDAIVNDQQPPRGAEVLLESLAAETDPAKYITVVNEITAMYAGSGNILTNALSKLGL